jgi:hypothetical protein
VLLEDDVHVVDVSKITWLYLLLSREPRTSRADDQ